MPDASLFLLTIGGILLLGLITDILGRHTFLPRISLLILFGILIGPNVLNLIPGLIVSQFDIIAKMTLLMLGFLLGGKLSTELLSNVGKQMLWISLCTAIGTTLVVSIGFLIIGLPVELAIIFGCLAAATDPAATYDVINQGKQGPITSLLLSIVAIDDAWTLIIFSIGITFVSLITGIKGDATFSSILIKDIGGAIVIGLIIGIPAAYATGRIKQGQPMLIEAIGIVFICGGLALWLDVSYLIASMIIGMVIVNFAKHHDYPFHTIEDIEWIFLIIFFVLAGASLDFTILKEIGLIGIIYIILRIIGKIIGARIGGHICNKDKNFGNWIGIALLPQAGIAMGMALVAASQLPEYRQTILSVVISTTIIFELMGPALTRLAVNRLQN